ncbi:DUF2182 domain-containing protein [Jannaschia sp. KMU-145]|uniref:DUF2182 domain-containing protein n=1 Tax=Jannaschia halovivens TaxID=3388667 RepID=UPI00396AF03B
MTAPHWLALYGLLLGGWVALWAWSAPTSWGTLLRDLCLSTPEPQGLVATTGMWLLMSAAMMLPTAIPAFATHDDIADTQGTGGGAALVAGYALVWAGFAVAAALVQTALATADIPRTGAFAAALLISAAAYQVSPMKAACLSKCRRPLVFFMQHWAEGPFRMGVRLGATCLGCCWALMALGLIGGAMSLAFMALATVLMTLEKLGRGPAIPVAIAIACLAGAGFLIGA